MKREIFDNYATAVANKFHLSLDEMFTKTKKIEVVEARQMLYFLSREYHFFMKRTFFRNRDQVTRKNISS